jgi:hypothetical protein
MIVHSLSSFLISLSYNITANVVDPWLSARTDRRGDFEDTIVIYTTARNPLNIAIRTAWNGEKAARNGQCAFPTRHRKSLRLPDGVGSAERKVEAKRGVMRNLNAVIDLV